MNSIDLNSDLGESFGNYKIGMDEKVIEVVSSVNVACGCHAGDPIVMDKTVLFAKESGTAIGAHPGYPDLQGFGRRNMALSPAEAAAYVIYQVGALDAFCKKHGVKMHHVKPHGALYNTSAKDPKLAQAIAEAIYSYNPELILVGLAGSESIKAGKAVGLKTCGEYFADRAYEEDGTLRARTKSDAMIHDEEECVERVIRMVKEGKVRAVTGNDIEIEAQTICVHGDGEKAIAFARKIKEALIAEHISVEPSK
ncbi:MAG: LamB/YcsF family protein [Lachnospiraceae bacterium]|nr:LamB/YcsF family protein [Candidatus Equihabitans merdae]